MPGPAQPFQQHWRFGAALEALGQPACRALMRDRQGDIGQALILRRRIAGMLRVALISRGPIWQTPDPARRQAGLEALAAKLRPGLASGVLLTPEEAPNGAGIQAAAKIVTPASVAEWHISADPAALRAGLRQTWRHSLARAERAGLRLRSGPPDAGRLATLLDKDRAQQKARRYRSYPAALTAAWAGTGPHAARAYSAHAQDGTCLAEALFLLHAPVATYHIALNTGEGRSACAQHFLLWAAACQLAGQGYDRIDLGALDTERLRGIARFKLGTGARVRRLGPTLFFGPATRALCSLPGR